VVVCDYECKMEMLSSGVIFQQSLQDLVKGIRSNRRDEASYIRQKLIEIQAECKKSDANHKSTAILKLTYLRMFGYPMTSVSFNVIEVISRPEYVHKRIGYLAAAQSFSPYTDVLLLTINQFKKDLTNGKLLDCSLALTALASFATKELGSECASDIATLLSSARPSIRKKSIVTCYKVTQVYPDSMQIFLPKLKERLLDSHPGVACAAVTVMCEFANSKPETLLSLAPILYELMNSESNNWMLIKVVKVMGKLVPLEPRLVKKLVDPMTRLLNSSRAKSLLYECCKIVVESMREYDAVVELAATKISEFTSDHDKNLKFLGLLLLNTLVQTHPEYGARHKSVILDCLDDRDNGIRVCALELSASFLTAENLREVSSTLLEKLFSINESSNTILSRNRGANGGQVAEDGAEDQSDQQQNKDSAQNRTENGISAQEYQPVATSKAEAVLFRDRYEFRDALVKQLLSAGQVVRENRSAYYPYLKSAADFEWYVSVVVEGLCDIKLDLSSTLYKMIAEQFVELTVRVSTLRAKSIQICEKLLWNESFGLNCMNEELVCGLLWIIGEYGTQQNTLQFDPKRVLRKMIDDKAKVLAATSKIQSAFITASMKLLIRSCCNELSPNECTAELRTILKECEVSSFAEVQERAALSLSFLECAANANGLAESGHFVQLQKFVLDRDFLPVDPRVQTRMIPPGGLELDRAFFEIEDIKADEFRVQRKTRFSANIRAYGDSRDPSSMKDREQAFWGNDRVRSAAEEASATLFTSSNATQNASFSTTSNSSQSSIARAYQQSPFYLGSSSSTAKNTQVQSDVSKPEESSNLDTMLIDLGDEVSGSTTAKTSSVNQVQQLNGNEGMEQNEASVASFPVEIRGDEIPENFSGLNSNQRVSNHQSVKPKKKKKKKSTSEHNQNVSMLITLDEPTQSNQEPAQQTPRSNRNLSANDLLG